MAGDLIKVVFEYMHGENIKTHFKIFYSPYSMSSSTPRSWFLGEGRVFKMSSGAAAQSQISRAARIHFALAAIFVLSTIIFDAWKLITPDVVLQRWTLAALLLIVATGIWYSSHFAGKNKVFHNILGFFLIFTDLLIATILVYNERGMASRSIILYAVPIITSGIVASRRAVYATASLATALYTLAAVRYFVLNFNEGYKIELYGTIGLYSAVFFIIAAIVNLLISASRD